MLSAVTNRKPLLGDGWHEVVLHKIAHVGSNRSKKGVDVELWFSNEDGEVTTRVLHEITKRLLSLVWDILSLDPLLSRRWSPDTRSSDKLSSDKQIVSAAYELYTLFTKILKDPANFLGRRFSILVSAPENGRLSIESITLIKGKRKPKPAAK